MTLNRVQLLGYVLGNPVINTTERLVPAASFTVETADEWTNKAGETERRPQWTRCVAYGTKVSIVQGLASGSQVYVEGPLSTRQDDKGGFHSEIRVKTVMPVHGRRSL